MTGVMRAGNAVALWLTTLAFPFQFMLAVAALLPLCAGGALAFDRIVGWIDAKRPTGRRSGD
jgi:elongation factor P--beta-lysine ligase